MSVKTTRPDVSIVSSQVAVFCYRGGLITKEIT
jgi:hypothetical protein